MNITAAEDALHRALDYLADSGLPLDSEIVAAVLTLIEQGVQQRADNLPAWVMQRLPEHFALTYPLPPPVQPALCRGSIGYEKY
jgi:hypothetical protein